MAARGAGEIEALVARYRRWALIIGRRGRSMVLSLPVVGVGQLARVVEPRLEVGLAERWRPVGLLSGRLLGFEFRSSLGWWCQHQADSLTLVCRREG